MWQWIDAKLTLQRKIAQETTKNVEEILKKAWIVSLSRKKRVSMIVRNVPMRIRMSLSQTNICFVGICCPAASPLPNKKLCQVKAVTFQSQNVSWPGNSIGLWIHSIDGKLVLWYRKLKCFVKNHKSTVYHPKFFFTIFEPFLVCLDFRSICFTWFLIDGRKIV